MWLCIIWTFLKTIQHSIANEQSNTLIEQSNTLIEQSNTLIEQPNTLIEQSNILIGNQTFHNTCTITVVCALLYYIV